MMTPSVLIPKAPKPVLPRASRVVVALTDADHARAVLATFRRQGWEVLLPSAGMDLRETTRKARARAVVLDASPVGRESGYLTCKKLLMERPFTKVVLVAPAAPAADRRLAAFVGATALVDGTNPVGVVSAVMGLRLPFLN